MKALMRNGTVARNGHTLQVQLLCSGEIKIAVEVYAARVAQMKHDKGCPRDEFYQSGAASVGSHRGIAKALRIRTLRPFYGLCPKRGRSRGPGQGGWAARQKRGQSCL